MKYIIEYEEIVKRINSVIIEVDSEVEGKYIADELNDSARDFNHPDDIFIALDDMGVKITDTYEGDENREYEINKCK